MTSEVLLSNWSKNATTLPKQYVFPPELRLTEEPATDAQIPVIDLSQDTTVAVEQLLKAAKEFGAFQVINHGVPEKLMDDAMNVSEELMELPAEDKEELYSNELKRGCRLFTGGLFYSETNVNCWKDTLLLPCAPIDEQITSWPKKPSNFKETMKSYTQEVKALHLRVIDMLGQGLGLKKGYFDGELSETHHMFVNYYPPCPEPTKAVGVQSHCDKNVLTFLQQRENGLQVLKDDKWIGVQPIPHAFVVNVADQLEVISNGIFPSARHRALTNSNVTRTSLVTFIATRMEGDIEPAEELITETRPAKFGKVSANPYKNYEIPENPLAVA